VPNEDSFRPQLGHQVYYIPCSTSSFFDRPAPPHPRTKLQCQAEIVSRASPSWRTSDSSPCQPPHFLIFSPYKVMVSQSTAKSVSPPPPWPNWADRPATIMPETPFLHRSIASTTIRKGIPLFRSSPPLTKTFCSSRFPNVEARPL